MATIILPPGVDAAGAREQFWSDAFSEALANPEAYGHAAAQRLRDAIERLNEAEAAATAAKERTQALETALGRLSAHVAELGPRITSLEQEHAEKLVAAAIAGDKLPAADTRKLPALRLEYETVLAALSDLAERQLPASKRASECCDIASISARAAVYFRQADFREHVVIERAAGAGFAEPGLALDTSKSAIAVLRKQGSQLMREAENRKFEFEKKGESQ